jgi:cysteine desulfurase / selenocysteine lyase
LNAYLAPVPAQSASFDVAALRAQFPILDMQVHGRPLVYLDNAATTQKPVCVMDRLEHYYRRENANVHRGVHHLSEVATSAFEAVRETIRRFVNARETREVIFTRGATEAVNLVANSLAQYWLKPGDEVLISWMEHHSNIVPWQMVCERTGAVLKVIPMTDAGELDMDAARELIGPRTRVLGIVHVSNALGTVNPVQELTRLAHEAGALVLVDGAQAVAHFPVDVQAIDCDFYVCSAHKLYGPTGVGALIGRAATLERMPPWQGGGDMIRVVRFEGTQYNELPYKFEAGTPNIGDVIAWGAAIDWLSSLDWTAVQAHEDGLLRYAESRAEQIDGLRIVGTAEQKAGVMSFVIDGVHPHDLGTIVDHHGVAIRTGHHCAMPVMERLCVPATARASFALYNTREEVDVLISALSEAREVLG